MGLRVVGMRGVGRWLLTGLPREGALNAGLPAAATTWPRPVMDIVRQLMVVALRSRAGHVPHSRVEAAGLCKACEQRPASALAARICTDSMTLQL
jgi:hypothetical protein